MNRTVLLLAIVMATAAAAQQPEQPSQPAPQVALSNLSERVQAPTYSDVYCAGFISNQEIPRSMYVTGGWDTPHATKFADGDYVYLTGGGFQEGVRYSIVRPLRDPNRWEAYRGQRTDVGRVGQPYAELGRVRIIGMQRGSGIAVVEFACQDIVPGDIATPFAAKEIPQLAPGAVAFDRFVAPSGKTAGRIVMTKEFDSLVGTGSKVYLDVGAGQGVKVGDYFRAYREYTEMKRDEGESLSFKATQTEDNQKQPVHFNPTLPKLPEFPRKNLGEMVVLSVSPNSATAMVTRSIEDIHVGDGVEMFEPPPPPPPPAAAAPQPPTISCFANPATVRVGETATVTCEAASTDNRPLSFAFASTAGQLTQRDNTAHLVGTEPGSVSVRATVSDDRNLTAMALTTVNVEALPAAPAASKINEIMFAPNSARVDNAAKAILDDVALRMQREADSTAVIAGQVDEGESGRLAERRANNAKAYLTKAGGIDPARVQTKAGAEPGKRADIWIVPAGAAMPE